MVNTLPSPLEDIRDTERIHTVIQRGVVIDRAPFLQ
jgi:hypothetical protein